MQLTVLCFAQTREILGGPTLALQLSAGANVGDLQAALERRAPALKRIPLRFAVNREFATAQTVLNAGDEIALIPPVAGG
jgi:molybdopterin converting factor subunit 1